MLNYKKHKFVVSSISDNDLLEKKKIKVIQKLNKIKEEKFLEECLNSAKIQIIRTTHINNQWA